MNWAQSPPKASEPLGVKPSELRLWGAVISGIMMLVIGIVLMSVSISANDSVFIWVSIIWICIGLGWVLYGIYQLLSDVPDRISLYEIDVEYLRDTPPEYYDFEVNLRKLESLRRDGLISEEEYQRKRTEIMYQRW
jgi:hypothetical protein